MLFIALFHLTLGGGMMFSIAFQQKIIFLYGAQLDWNAQTVYFMRILGAFAFVLGFLALAAARDPARHQAIILGFAVFFILRNLNRHLYSTEVYEGFAVTPAMNNLTTVFFSTQAVLLLILLWRMRREDGE